MDQTIIPFPQLIELLTSVLIGWVLLFVVVFIGFCIQKQWLHKKKQREQQKLNKQKEQEELNKLKQTVQEMLVGEQLYFFRKEKKIANKHGNELPQLKDYCCRLAPFADCASMPDKAFRVFIDCAIAKDTLLFRPESSGWTYYFEVEALAPDNTVILTNPIMGTLCLHNTENQATHIGQKMAVYQVTRFKDGIYSSFFHIPSTKPYSFM